MIQIIVVSIVVTSSFYFGYKMAESTGDMFLRYRELEVDELKKQIEAMDKWSDTLFNEEDMIRIGQQGYIAGMRRDDTWKAEKWIDETFKPIEQ